MKFMRRIFGSLILFLLCFASVTQADTLPVYALEGDVIKLTNDHYDVSLSAKHGGIIAIKDQSTGANISDGSVGENLWSALFDKGSPMTASEVEMTHAWDEANSTLTLTYAGTLAVAINITVDESASLKLQAALTNASGAIISDFVFPGQLKMTAADIQDALLPMLPGALISPVFFAEGRSFINVYPGVMFADYLAVRSTRGSIAVYAQQDDILQPALIGYETIDGEAAITHRYNTWIADGTNWLSPVVILTIGQAYPATIASYRAVNGMDAYPSLTEKLGAAAPAYFAAPMYKLDVQVLKLKFAELNAAIINQINFPGLVHFVAFHLAGHDKNYPSFIPPDPKWGTTEDFAAAVDAVHSQGGLVLAYTNFSWWDNDGPVMLTLPADSPLNTIISVKDSHGLPGFETHGPNSGFVMNLNNAFVKDVITEQHTALKEVGADAIFEDQWGARAVPYDFNPAGLAEFDPSTAYFAGVLDHYRRHRESGLMTELGVDVLAENGIGFMGTNYLWDKLGYRSATAGVTTYYPLAGMLLRDKVLLYQHNLAAETWTDNKNMLRWNLAQGYNLSIAFHDKKVQGLNMDNPWLNLAGVFQKYVLANYADELVQSYEDAGDQVKKTVFASYTVYSNWNAAEPLAVGDHILPPGGVVTQANDGSVTAGVFTAYHNAPLSAGEHYLVEVRSTDDIKIFQPVGDATDISIRNHSDWTTVEVTAYRYDDTPVGTIEATIEGENIIFRYDAALNDEEVGYYRITAGK